MMTNPKVASHTIEIDNAKLKSGGHHPKTRKNPKGAGRPKGAKNKIDPIVQALSGLKPDGICKIIRECKESKVLEFKFGDLRITFDGYEPDPAEHRISTDTRLDQNQLNDELQRDEVREKVDGIDDDLEQLSLTDPALFEQLMITGEAET